MKFFGTPNMLVKIRQRVPLSAHFKLKPAFRFDENGEYEIDDPKLIEKLKKKFRYEETQTEQAPTEKTYCCRKCSFTTENRGVLLRHYQQEHPKEASN